MVVGTTLWVLIRVRVRVPKNGLRPRRFTNWAPTLKLPSPTLLPAKKLEFCGSSATTEPALVRLSFWISCSFITVTGLGVLKVLRVTRDPVTTISSVVAGLEAWASAAPAASRLKVRAVTLAEASRSRFA